jgi:hypothetical protein
VTQRFPWPRDAQAARDESAIQANEIIVLLEPLLTDDYNTQNLDRIIGRAVSAAHKICRLLEREGAPTLPPK